MNANAMRRKERCISRPHRDVVSFEATRLPPDRKKAELYCASKRRQGWTQALRCRWIRRNVLPPLSTQDRWCSRAMVVWAHLLAISTAMDRFDNVLKKFRITEEEIGRDVHGLRHGALIDRYQELTGEAPPVHGGANLPKDIDAAGRGRRSPRLQGVRERRLPQPISEAGGPSSPT